jgi:hypothetical protein
MIDPKEIENMIRSEIRTKITAALDMASVGEIAGESILEIASEKMEVTVTAMLNNLLRDGTLNRLIEDKLLQGLQSRLDDLITSRAAGMVSRVDVGTQISEKIERFVVDAMQNAALPDGLIPLRAVNLRGLELSADDIVGGVYKDFNSTGIQDTANEPQLTIMDGAVIVEQDLISNKLSVEDSAEIKGNINVAGDLRLQGNLVVLNPAFSKQIQGMVQDAIANDKASSKMDIGADALYANGKEILRDNALGSGIAFSNLRKVGNLTELTVTGSLTASGTLSVADGRVGINTDDPSGAFTIWDEDAELTIRKHKAKTTYLGTTRDCDLVLGTNGNIGLALRRDGTVSVNKMELGGLLITVSDAAPERDGQPGELVIMRTAKEDLPWAYQCMEGKRWAALKR